MPIRHEDIKGDRLWRAATGLTDKQFYALTAVYADAYEQQYGQSIAERRANSTQAPIFTTYAEQLFYALYSIKSGLTHDLLAVSFGISQSSAHELQSRILATLRRGLAGASLMPTRSYATVEAFVADWIAEGAILIDATEQRRQRPEAQEAQKATYSGKKKAHTTKVMVLATASKVIKFVSPPYLGKVHDFALLKSELPPEAGWWFRGREVHVDLGYLGFGKAYGGATVSIPVRKPKNGELTGEQKESNRAKSKQRVVVENAIGGMKRYRFLSDRLRCHDLQLYSMVVAIAAGLWNFNLTC